MGWKKGKTGLRGLEEEPRQQRLSEKGIANIFYFRARRRLSVGDAALITYADKAKSYPKSPIGSVLSVGIVARVGLSHNIYAPPWPSPVTATHPSRQQCGVLE